MTQYQPALSPSRAKDYLQCPLKFRFLVVDRLPSPPTQATVRGTLVHAVLEDLFLTPQADRNLERAESLLKPIWNSLTEKNPDYADVLDETYSLANLLTDCQILLANYFALENPQNLSPSRREEMITARLSSGVNLRGIIDRIDEAPNGALRVIDYKTGKAPSPRFTGEALFQMKFYALLLSQVGPAPARMQLLYLKSKRVLTLDPQPETISEFEMEIEGLWTSIERNLSSGVFPTKKGPLCGWCDFQSLCPEFGGSPAPAQPAELQRVQQIRS